jgi:FKBP-type peptidyl-prolyl cis-trans isomerase
MVKARREKIVRAIIEKNEAEAKRFFTELDKNTNVVKLAGGIRYEITKPGSGAYPKPQQTVNVHYIAHLIDGTEFMQFGPIDMVLVANRSNPFHGWVECMQEINRGGKIKFCLPPPLPEEEAVKWGIEPGSTRIYEVELLDIKDTSPEDLETAMAAPPPELEPPPPSGFGENHIIETWGWNVARLTHISELEFGDAELSWLTKGLAAGIKGQSSPYELAKIYPDVEKFVNVRWERARLAFKQKQLASSEAFFTELKRNTNVVELASGLRYEILKPGTGPYPKTGKTIKINYVGYVRKDAALQQFDDDTNVYVPISNHPSQWIIPGWAEGLQKINKGGTIKLYIPYQLGYGDQRFHSVPPYSTLVYEIQAVDITDTPTDESVPASEKK